MDTAGMSPLQISQALQASADPDDHSPLADSLDARVAARFGQDFVDFVRSTDPATASAAALARMQAAAKPTA